MSESKSKSDILQSDIAKWRLVIEATYGQESPVSCAVVEGKLTLLARPRPYPSKPDLALLCDMLRSNEPIPPGARVWLADLFDPTAKTDYWVKEFARRDGKKAQTGPTHNWDAAHYAEMLMLFGDRYDDDKAPDSRKYKSDEALNAAAKKFGIQKSAVQTALRSIRKARDIHDKSL